MVQEFRYKYPQLWRKMDILCHGIAMDNNGVLDSLYHAQNPRDTKRTGNAGLQVKLDNGTLPLNVAVFKKFSEHSPYKFFDNNTLLDTRDEFCIPVYCPPSCPDWYMIPVGDDIVASDRVLLEGDFTAITSITKGCIYFNKKQQCEFCALGDELINKKEILDWENQVKSSLVAAARDPNILNIHLTGGNTLSSDRGASQYYEIIECVREANPQQRIAIEIPPPEPSCQEKVFTELKTLGADSITLNIEFWDDEVRKKLMPIKGAFSRDEYISAFKAALQIFGKNKVSCGFIIGIEPLSKTKEATKILTAMGIIVEVYPFKPNDGCKMENEPPCDTDSVIDISLFADYLMKEFDIHPDQTSGCVKCGACGITQELLSILNLKGELSCIQK